MEADQSLATGANQRLDFLYRLNERLAQAEDEEMLVEVGLDLVQEAVPALGCSLLRFDAHGHLLPAVHRGDLDPAWFEAWADHLLGNGDRLPCPTCSAPRAAGIVPCRRAVPSWLLSTVGRVYCLAIARHGQEYGILNVYLREGVSLGEPDRLLIQAVTDGLALALEGQTLRSRETAMLHHLQDARRQSRLQQELAQILAHAIKALSVDGGALWVTDPETRALDRIAQAGEPAQISRAQDLVKSLTQGSQGLTQGSQGLTQGSQGLEKPVLVDYLEQTGSATGEEGTLLIVPLCGNLGPLGSLALWAAAAPALGQQDVQLAATLADQVALLIENQRLYLQSEHEIILAERARLAREIHDGLAQTLGYLKLRAAQIGRWLERGESKRSRAALEEMEGVLSEAYVDVREAIDGLPLKPGKGQMQAWLEQILADFQRYSGIFVEAALPTDFGQPPEAEVQLIRIVQEALSNVRRHAAASHVWLTGAVDRQGLMLCITDDGRGFDAADVPLMSQHGLRIMRERAELLDADLQISSRPGAGTSVVVRVPPTVPREETNA